MLYRFLLFVRYKTLREESSYIHFCISISGRGFVYISKHDYSEYDNVFINNRNRPTTVSDWSFFICRRFWLFNWNEISYDFMKKKKIINRYYGIWLWTVFYSISCTYTDECFNTRVVFYFFNVVILWFSSVYRFLFSIHYHEL